MGSWPGEEGAQLVRGIEKGVGVAATRLMEKIVPDVLAMKPKASKDPYLLKRHADTCATPTRAPHHHAIHAGGFPLTRPASEPVPGWCDPRSGDGRPGFPIDPPTT